MCPFYRYEPKEYLILGTQASNDIVAIHNHWTGGSPKSDVLPIYVPNRIDTLHEARTNGILGDISFTNKLVYLIFLHTKQQANLTW